MSNLDAGPAAQQFVGLGLGADTSHVLSVSLWELPVLVSAVAHPHWGEIPGHGLSTGQCHIATVPPRAEWLLRCLACSSEH